MEIFLLFYLIGFFVFYCYLCRVTQLYAIRNGRESVSWFLFAFFFSPILAAFCIYMLGETDERHRNRIIEEEYWRKNVYLKVNNEVERQNVITENEAETKIECSGIVNTENWLAPSPGWEDKLYKKEVNIESGGEQRDSKLMRLFVLVFVVIVILIAVLYRR